MNEEKYEITRFVYWPVKINVFGIIIPFGMQGASFGKVIITKDYIELGVSIFNKTYKVNKLDIDKIEFTSSISNFPIIKMSPLFKYCTITPKEKSLPEWLAFSTTNEDIEKLKEFKYIN